jgi:hypothetical protein
MTAPKWLGGFGNCCCGDCILLSDDFEREEIGTDWEVSTGGSWNIISGDLRQATDDGVLIHVTEFTETKLAVKSTFRPNAVGDRPRLIIGWEDSSNYFFAQVRVTEDQSFLSLGQVDGGVETYLSNEAAQHEDSGIYGKDEDINLWLCYSSSTGLLRAMLRSSTGGYGQYQSVAVTLPGTYRVGIEVHQNGSVQFHDFEVNKCSSCSRKCAIVDDDFNRADIGENWDVRSGSVTMTWPGGDYGGVEIADTNSLIVSESAISVHENSLSPYAQVVESDITVEAGGAAMLVIAYTNDSTYHYAKWALSSDGLTETLGIYSSASGTALTSTTVNTYGSPGVSSISTRLRVCYSGYAINAELFPDGTVISWPVTTATGMRSGFGTKGSSGLVTFNQYMNLFMGSGGWIPDPGSPNEYQYPAECPTCTSACSVCDADYPAPPEITATIGAGLTDGECGYCDQIAGEYVLRNTGGCCWTYKKLNVCSWHIGGTTPDPLPRDLAITLCVENAFGGNVKWTLTIELMPTAGTMTTIDPLTARTAIYTTTLAKDAQSCQNPPATLTRTGSDLIALTIDGYNHCEGASPATVSLSA